MSSSGSGDRYLIHFDGWKRHLKKFRWRFVSQIPTYTSSCWPSESFRTGCCWPQRGHTSVTAGRRPADKRVPTDLPVPEGVTPHPLGDCLQHSISGICPKMTSCLENEWKIFKTYDLKRQRPCEQDCEKGIYPVWVRYRYFNKKINKCSLIWFSA